MKWIPAITAVLAETGTPMHYNAITDEVFAKGYRIKRRRNSDSTVYGILYQETTRFKNLGSGYFELIDTFVTAPHSTVSRVAPPVVVRPSSSYTPGDSKYKRASDFVKGSSVLSKLEMELLDLIVNFRLPLEKGEVCFADILDNLDVEILEEERSRTQSVDATILEQKLRELKEQIADMEAKPEHNPNLRNGNEYECKLGRMRSAAIEAEQRLQEASEGKVVFQYPILGEFVTSGSKPKVVIYLKSIEKSIRGIESRGAVMAGVFVHEMFHACNYFIAGQKSRSILAIDEPMVEFATLYFLKELEAFTKSQYHSLKGEVLCAKLYAEFRVQNKQQSIGDVAAYGFGYYLFDEFKKGNVDPIKWIETYSKKSASISHNSTVKNVEDALIPVYPFKSEDKVFKWFEKIIFSGRATLATTRKSTTKRPAPTSAPVTTKPKKAKSIPFAVEFPDDKVKFNEKKAVKTYIKSLKHIGLVKVQGVGIMIADYNLVSDDERPPKGRNKWQDYEDSKYIYTKLSNQVKKAYLYQIADKLGIKIKIYDI